MSKPLGSELPGRVIDHLVGGHPVAVATRSENGHPYLSIVGSCVAIDATTLRFAAFSSGTTLANIRRDGRVFVETLGDDLVVGIEGLARIVKEPMQASAYPPHHYAMVEIEVANVKDDHPPGAKIIGMTYGFDYSRDPEERLRRRRSLLEEIRSEPKLNP